VIDPLALRAAEYYSGTLQRFGATPQGADWKNLESQQLRFAQLLRIADGDGRVSVNDYGCGYGALVDHLRAGGRVFEYGGYDASPAMIEAAIAEHHDPACHFTSDRAALARREYTVASGVFNVKGTTPTSEWWAYVTRSLDDIASASSKGFACNFLTSYADAPKMRDNLFYADPSDVLRHCLTRFSRHAAVLHDYPLYEFTIMVRL
jgi:SAM-dependent methyltransferase